MKYPITVNNIEFVDSPLIRPEGLFSGKRGQFVSVRPCGDKYQGKTFLGVFLGEAALSISAALKKETGVLSVERTMYNPMIYIPETKDIVFGCESWWGEIESPEQLRKITDEDINNVWYVQALKQLSEEEDEPVEVV